ncbi:MAG: SUMF1/EgtB/PvdO family nonheme iron enzyme [Kiritimatiellae bacterium]|nr:SUMF1/EgtB/PvdO family nonheme iron enzyme [Kiritimatiellia bacterium]
MDSWEEYLDESERKTTRDGGCAGAVLADRYRVVRRLGQGGMGSVLLAEDAQLDNLRVAVKMLPSFLVANKRAYMQLKKEALVSLKLSHPNIVTLRAFEENGGNPFLVMDYVEGRTLDDLLAEKGTLTEEETVALLTPVAAALDYAHTRGVVHRDVKPGNVMIAGDGTPLVLDFGIAREVQETLTRVTGRQSSGTLSYMSPEQLNGAAPNAAQDVYSFAAMAYECLTGNPPFCRGQIEYQIVNNHPEPLPDGIGIAAGIMAGLAKTPVERPANCAAVLGQTASPLLASGGATSSLPASRPLSFSAGGPAAPATSSLPAHPYTATTEADAKRVRVEAKIRKMRIERLSDNDGFAERKARLEEVFLKAEMFFESQLWSDAAREYAEYVKQTEELEELDAERKRREREEAERKQREREEAERKQREREEANRKAGVKTITLPGGVEMRFRWCPPGSFLMGSPTSEEGRLDDDETQHRVTLTKGCWMAETEVTQKQWQSVMGSNPSHFRGNDRPVEQVSWNDCQEFIKKVNARLSDMHVRLPTEAEWEYACRAGTIGAYGGTGNLDEMGWYKENSGDETHPVAQKKPNVWGLYDMHGNVHEWCADWFGEYPSDSVTDPTGPSSGSDRVLRGGCWLYDALNCCRPANRFGSDPGRRDSRIGFRLLCSAGPRG